MPIPTATSADTLLPVRADDPSVPRDALKGIARDPADRRGFEDVLDDTHSAPDGAPETVDHTATATEPTVCPEAAPPPPAPLPGLMFHLRSQLKAATAPEGKNSPVALVADAVPSDDAGPAVEVAFAAETDDDAELQLPESAPASVGIGLPEYPAPVPPPVQPPTVVTVVAPSASSEIGTAEVAEPPTDMVAGGRRSAEAHETPASRGIELQRVGIAAYRKSGEPTISTAVTTSPDEDALSVEPLVTAASDVSAPASEVPTSSSGDATAWGEAAPANPAWSPRRAWSGGSEAMQSAKVSTGTIAAKESATDGVVLAESPLNVPPQPTDLAQTPVVASPTFSSPISRPEVTEKIAAEQVVAPTASTRMTDVSSAARKKNTGVFGSERVEESEEKVGTEAAKSDQPMSFESRNTRAGAVREDGFSAVAGVDVTMGRAAQAQAPAATTAPKSMSAAEAVRQVLDVADQVAASRSTVDVKLQLDHARVSVRVEYRSDQVHVTFRTDSAEMREALSQAWQAQSASAEKKSYTFAEPVFANAAPTPVASSGSSQGFSLGDGARQQSQSQSQQQQQQSRSSEAGGASFLSTLAGIRSRPTAPVSTEARPVVSTDSARLQAFA